MKTEYTLNTKHFRDEIISCMDKAKLKELCDVHNIPIKTSADRKYISSRLSDRIASATLIIEWEDHQNGRKDS